MLQEAAKKFIFTGSSSARLRGVHGCQSVDKTDSRDDKSMKSLLNTERSFPIARNEKRSLKGVQVSVSEVFCGFVS